MGLREEKKQATRAALSWAATRLAVERGFDNVLVEDIAAAAGVSPRTFNNYFGSKGEAIAARHLDRCLATVAELRARPAGEPLWEALRASVMPQTMPGPEVRADPVTDRDRWVAGVRVMVSHPQHQAEFLRAAARAETELAAAVAARTGTDPETDLYPKLVAAAVLAAVNAATSHWISTDAATDVGALLDEAIHCLAAGLPPPDPSSGSPPGHPSRRPATPQW